MMRSSNPALRTDTFSNPKLFSQVTTDTMTVSGTVNKSLVLLLILIASAAYTWNLCMEAIRASASIPTPLILVGALGGLGVGMVTIFVKKIAMYTAPIYSLLEGIVLGTVSALMELRYPGIVTQAVLGTVCVFITMFVLYKTSIIRATENFKLGVAAATGGIFLVYLATWILNFFGKTIPYIHDAGWVGIGFSLFVVGIAALNLVMDFDFIESGEKSRAPKFMEWYGAFALMVTLIWLYMEILRLLAKTRSRK